MLKDDRGGPFWCLSWETSDQKRRIAVGVPCDVISLIAQDWLRSKAHLIVSAGGQLRNGVEEPNQINEGFYGGDPPCG